MLLLVVLPQLYFDPRIRVEGISRVTTATSLTKKIENHKSMKGYYESIEGEGEGEGKDRSKDTAENIQENNADNCMT